MKTKTTWIKFGVYNNGKCLFVTEERKDLSMYKDTRQIGTTPKDIESHLLETYKGHTIIKFERVETTDSVKIQDAKK